MNSDSSCQTGRCGAYAIGILGTFLVMGGLVALMRHYTAAPSLNEDRAAERMKILADFHEANDPLLTRYDWQDKDKGFVRVPIDRAKELVLEEWQNPSVAHSNLMERAAKEFAPAPKPPAVKSIFE